MEQINLINAKSWGRGGSVTGIFSKDFFIASWRKESRQLCVEKDLSFEEVYIYFYETGHI